MNKWFALLFLAVTTFSHAQVSGTQKIATVSFNAAVVQTAEAQKEMGALKTKYAPRQAQLQALNDEIEGLRKQIRDSTDKLSDTEMASRERSLESKEKQLQRETEDFKNDSEGDSQEVYQRIAQKVYTFLQTYAQQRGYSAVIERGSDAAPIVWFAAAGMDITGELVKAYNAQSSSALPETPSPHR